MPDYRVSIKASAEKELLALPDSIATRIFPRIESLCNDPRPRGVKKLRGASDLWRIRVGDYRVVYSIDDRRTAVVVMRVAHRGQVYE